MGRNYSKTWLGWPFQELPHVRPCYHQEPQLAFVRRALASLHTPSYTRNWSLETRLPFSTIPWNPEFRHRHALFSLSNTINIALSVRCFLACRKEKHLWVLFLQRLRVTCTSVSPYSFVGSGVYVVFHSPWKPVIELLPNPYQTNRLSVFYRGTESLGRVLKIQYRKKEYPPTVAMALCDKRCAGGTK